MTIDGVKMPYYEIKFSQASNNEYKASKSGCAGSKDEDCQLFDVSCTDLTLMFLEAKYCEPGIVRKMKDVDYVVLNCGHFPATTSHYTFGQFRDVIQNMLGKMIQAELFVPLVGNPWPTTLFWLENTAQPLRQDDYIVKTEDWRTYHRLALYDAVVKEEAKKMIPGKLNLVPAFQSSLSVFDKLCNCGHYSDSAMIPQLIAVLDVIRDTMLKKL
jgi:hypothetical protein